MLMLIEDCSNYNRTLINKKIKKYARKLVHLFVVRLQHINFLHQGLDGNMFTVKVEVLSC